MNTKNLVIGIMGVVILVLGGVLLFQMGKRSAGGGSPGGAVSTKSSQKFYDDNSFEHWCVKEGKDPAKAKMTKEEKEWFKTLINSKKKTIVRFSTMSEEQIDNMSEADRNLISGLMMEFDDYKQDAVAARNRKEIDALRNMKVPKISDAFKSGGSGVDSTPISGEPSPAKKADPQPPQTAPQQAASPVQIQAAPVPAPPVVSPSVAAPVPAPTTPVSPQATAGQSPGPVQSDKFDDPKPVTAGKVVSTRTLSFRPGASGLCNEKEILDRVGRDVGDVWIYGRFSLISGGPRHKKQLDCLEAGERTRRWTGVLVGDHDRSKMALYCFGWSFDSGDYPDFNCIGDKDTVIEVTKEKPAKVVKAYWHTDGSPIILCTLTSPPKINP